MGENEHERAIASYEQMMEKNREIGEPREAETRLGLESHIYIVRHGTSTLEVEDKRPLQERDFERELSPQGEAEADAAGDKIAEDVKTYIGEGIIVLPGGSTLPRAHKTSERAMRRINERLGHPYPDDMLSDPAVRGPVSKDPDERKRRALNTRYSVPEYIYPPHAAGKKRLKEAGEWGRGETLPDEWMRNPDLLQKDIDSAGLGELFDASDIVAERTNNFVMAAGMWETAGRALRSHWEKAMQGDPQAGIQKFESRKGGGVNISADHPPHMVFIGGTHGSIIPEAWLHRITRRYEDETGAVVSPTLEYGEFFKVHIPATEKETPTLTIHDHTMPIPWELFNIIYTGVKEEPAQQDEESV